MGDSFSTVEGIQYSVLWRDTFNTVRGCVDVVQYSGDDISTVGDSFSTVKGIQYILGITSVLWRVFSTVGDTFSAVGDTFSAVGG